MEQTSNQEPNLPHSDKTKDIFNRWIREEGTIDFSGGQYLVSRQRGCKGENIYFGGKQNGTEQNRTEAEWQKRKKKVSFLSATTSDGLFKTPTSVTTKTQQKEEWGADTQAHYWSFSLSSIWQQFMIAQTEELCHH